MARLVNRAQVSTSTTGTGTVTLGAALPGFRTFAAAGIADGDEVRYVIEDGANWEIGVGTYSSTGPTLARLVEESSNSNSAISLSGAARVYVAATADDFRLTQQATLQWDLYDRIVGSGQTEIALTNLDPRSEWIFSVASLPSTSTDAGNFLTVEFSADNLATTFAAAFRVSPIGNISNAGEPTSGWIHIMPATPTFSSGDPVRAVYFSQFRSSSGTRTFGPRTQQTTSGDPLIGSRDWNAIRLRFSVGNIDTATIPGTVEVLRRGPAT